MDDDGPSTRHFDFRKDVGTEKNGVLFAEFTNQAARFTDLGRIKAGRRFIQDQHSRISQQRVRQSNALTIPPAGAPML